MIPEATAGTADGRGKAESVRGNVVLAANKLERTVKNID